MSLPHATVSARLDALMAAADPALGVLPAAGLAAARSACELAAELERPLEAGRAGSWLCGHLWRLGRHAEALAEAQAMLARLGGPELLTERRALLRLVRMAGCETGAFDIALDAAHELVRITGPDAAGGHALDAALSLAMCLERMGDSWQAVRVLTQALQSHGAAASDLPLLMATNALCVMSIGMVHRLLHSGADAEVREELARARAAGEHAYALMAQLPDPAAEVAIGANLGEVMLLQGESAAAGPLLRRALALAQERGLGAQAWGVEATLGNWWLAEGRPEQALAVIQRLLAAMGPQPPHLIAVRAHHVAYRACRALGRFEEALTHFEVVERLERQRAVAQLRAQSQLFVTRTETQWAQWQAGQARLDAQHERQRAAEFAASAERDPLTGLGNRRHLERRTGELLPAAQRDARPVALAQLDIDHFKVINDTHGHAAGDQALVALAQLLRENTRVRDVLVRQGGEEFVIVLPGTTPERAAEVCERLRERVALHPWRAPGGDGFKLTVSIGLCTSPPYELAALMQSADEALYRAKRSGRNRLCLA